ncbi:hypothetical protein HYU89_00995 [Candidatus Collierbacteria bacterium]|nr:hypothetical protein [Candidatus Collierbacteria bacterium]
MHAFIVCGQNQNRVEERVEDLPGTRLGIGRIEPKNRLDLNPSAKAASKIPTLTIEDVRFITNWLSQKTIDQRAVIIHQAQTLTIPAQHAILKILEEPGENNYIILIADSESSLLPTIRSRCKIIRLPTEASATNVDSTSYSMGILHSLTEIGNKSPSEKLTILYDLLSEFSAKKFSPYQSTILRPDALKFMENIIVNLHQALLQYSTPGLQRSTLNAQRSITNCLVAACLSHRRLKNNLNVQLALQQFVLDIPKK